MLDVATGKGQFVATLIDDLASYREIVGVDADATNQAAFDERFGALSSVSFAIADAVALPFESASFDMVAMSGSMHHLSEPERVLSEMLRVLRPGGAFVILEQLRDGQRGSRLTHRQFHEWSEELLGIARRTYTRAELLELVLSLDLSDMQMVKQHDTSDPREPAKVARYDAFIDEYLGKSAGRPDMIERGLSIRDRLHATGINVASWLSVMGTKA